MSESTFTDVNWVVYKKSGKIAAVMWTQSTVVANAQNHYVFAISYLTYLRFVQCYIQLLM